jgi:hypothetical protein
MYASLLFSFVLLFYSFYLNNHKCTLKPAHSVTFHYVALDWMTATRDTDISFCLPTDLTMSAAVPSPSSCLAVDQGHQETTHCHSQPSVSLQGGTRRAVNTGADKALLNPLIIISPSQLDRCTYRQCRTTVHCLTLTGLKFLLSRDERFSFYILSNRAMFHHGYCPVGS